MSDAISAHGTLVARQNLGAGAFTTIAELRDTTPPALMRNSVETTPHNDTDDQYIPGGVRRRGEMTFQLNFLPGTATHDEQTGLMKSWYDKQLDGWRVTYPDGSVWIFSGFITNIGPTAAVDEALVADVTIRPTKGMSIS